MPSTVCWRQCDIRISSAALFSESPNSGRIKPPALLSNNATDLACPKERTNKPEKSPEKYFHLKRGEQKKYLARLDWVTFLGVSEGLKTRWGQNHKVILEQMKELAM